MKAKLPWKRRAKRACFLEAISLASTTSELKMSEINEIKQAAGRPIGRIKPAMTKLAAFLNQHEMMQQFSCWQALRPIRSQLSELNPAAISENNSDYEIE